MNDNTSAFQSKDYNIGIDKTLPYYYDIHNQIVDLVRTIKGDEKISWLDIGCGTGNFTKIALDSFNIDNLVVCDTSVKMLEVCKSKLSSTKVSYENVSALDLKYQNAFDVVTSIQVNHYLNYNDRITSIQNSYNTLKDKGIFITFENFSPFTTMGESISLDRWKEYQVKHGKSLEEASHHIKRYGVDYFPITINQHLDILKSCGFGVVEVLWVSYMQVGFYAIKNILTFNCSGIDTIQKLHQRIQSTFEFPYWYGKNWDAFRDILDLSEIDEIQFLNYNYMNKSISEHCEKFIELINEHKEFYHVNCRLNYL